LIARKIIYVYMCNIFSIFTLKCMNWNNDEQKKEKKSSLFLGIVCGYYNIIYYLMM